MSQISKAIEIAKRDGHIKSAIMENDDIHSTNYFDVTVTNKILTSKALLKKNRILTAIDDQRIIDSYRLLRTRVIRRMQQNHWKSVGITSAGPNDGKTLTAVNLGISIAMKQNYTVVVVDADMRNPSLHKLFGFKPKVGLSDYLKSNIALYKILVNPSIDNLFILPGGDRTSTSSELLSSPKMARLSNELKMRYPNRIIIYDLPPILVSDDVVAFSPNLDSALIVVGEGETDSGKLKKSINLLEGVEVIGTVLNKSKETQETYEYY